MPSSPLDKPPYTPLFPPPVQDVPLQQVENWVKQELDTIARYATAQPGTLFTPGNAIPARPRTGILTYADGTNWNPGYGEGLYVFKGGVWVPVGVGAGSRIRLSSPTSFFYKPSTGNDSGAGTNADPWAGPSPLASRYDFGGQNVTLNLLENTASPLALPAWTGGGSLTVDLNGHSIISTTGSAIAPVGLMPGRVTFQNGVLGATGTSHAAAIDMLNGAGQVFVSGITFNACTFAYVWLTGAGLGASTVIFVDTNLWAATAGGQLFGVICVFPCTFIGGGIGRPAVTKLTSNLTFSGSPMATLGGYIYSTTAGLATATWLKNGFTSTPNTALVLASTGGPAIQGYNDFAGFV